MRYKVAVQTLFCLILLAGPLGAVEKDDPVVKDFNQRVGEYIKLQKRLEGELPVLGKKATPEEISARKEALAAAIRKVRSSAQPGDIFAPPIKECFVQIIRRELRGKAGVSARETAKTGNPKRESPVPVTLAVNARYPDAAPRSSVPPMLLLQLPKLPKELEYRFVGPHLALLASEPNLIVDFILNAAPNLK